jgi:hypothetical protein
MAILNWNRPFSHRVLLALLWLCLAGALPAFDAPPSSLSPKFIAIAEEQLATARKARAAEPDNVERIWELGRAIFFRAEFTSGKERTALAEEGIAVCERGLSLAPDSAECHYYLAMNQGQLAREKLFGALGLVHRMREHLRAAAAAKPRLDHGGPDRCLALLHRDAPGWPISVGNRKEARRHLTKAYLLAPEYPENALVLLESWLKWGDTESLKEKLKAGEVALAKARRELTGNEWEPYHADWAERWTEVKEQASRELAE